MGCLKPSVSSEDKIEVVHSDMLVDELIANIQESLREVEEEKCLICFEDFIDSEGVSRPCLNSTNHSYHSSCLKKWMKSGNELSLSCPCCREQFAICKICDSFLGKKGETAFFCEECKAFTCYKCNPDKWHKSRREGATLDCYKCNNRLKKIEFSVDIDFNIDEDEFCEERRFRESFVNQFSVLSEMYEKEDWSYFCCKNKSRSRRHWKAKKGK
jgi:hypothetical protein